MTFARSLLIAFKRAETTFWWVGKQSQGRTLRRSSPSLISIPVFSSVE